MIIAIDGPAASGKSTIAKGLAQKLAFDYLDTGAMYRALTWKALQAKIDYSDEEALAALARDAKISFEQGGDVFQKKIFVNGQDISLEIRSPKVNRAVSIVSRVPAVRQTMAQKQREFAQGRNVVVEGRDIGTVVFPEAEVKVFLTASLRERAKRRQQELFEKGDQVPLATIEREVLFRDQLDSSRLSSPLFKAVDAHLVDTTEKKIEQVIEEILKLVGR